MQLQHNDGSSFHLTYCSNIHAGESLPEVFKNLRQHLPRVRQSLQFSGEMGVGLRLSAAAASALSEPANLTKLNAILDDLQCYIFTINGFPYGPFHGTRVKEDVYLPDWKDPERLRYTNQLADLFAVFLKEGTTGSISTVPGAFKANVTTPKDIEAMTSLYVSHCAHLARLEETTGKCIVLAIEPEPCCFLETIEESIDYFNNQLFANAAVVQLAQELQVDESTAKQLLQKHLTLCLDLCHAAVEYEQSNQCFAALKNACITIGKLQISAGLRLTDVTTESAECLEPFIDNVYLHQVIEQHGNTINRYTDLPQAFKHLQNDGTAREWRVHFHVPIFLDDLGDFSSTQFFVKEALTLHKNTPLSQHLEVETYTWDVLPEQYKNQTIDQAIARELHWVRNEL